MLHLWLLETDGRNSGVYTYFYLLSPETHTPESLMFLSVSELEIIPDLFLTIPLVMVLRDNLTPSGGSSYSKHWLTR